MAAGVRSTVVERRAGAAVFRVFSRSLRGLSALERVEVIVEGFGINKHHGKDIWGGRKPSLRHVVARYCHKMAASAQSTTNNTFKM